MHSDDGEEAESREEMQEAAAPTFTETVKAAPVESDAVDAPPLERGDNDLEHDFDEL